MGRVLGHAETCPGSDPHKMSGDQRTERAYLVKGDPEIDVHNLPRPIVHQNVGYVSIT